MLHAHLINTKKMTGHKSILVPAFSQLAVRQVYGFSREQSKLIYLSGIDHAK